MPSWYEHQSMNLSWHNANVLTSRGSPRESPPWSEESAVRWLKAASHLLLFHVFLASSGVSSKTTSQISLLTSKVNQRENGQAGLRPDPSEWCGLSGPIGLSSRPFLSFDLPVRSVAPFCSAPFDLPLRSLMSNLWSDWPALIGHGRLGALFWFAQTFSAASSQPQLRFLDLCVMGKSHYLTKPALSEVCFS